jgi:hypothetical protein
MLTVFYNQWVQGFPPSPSRLWRAGRVQSSRRRPPGYGGQAGLRVPGFAFRVASYALRVKDLSHTEPAKLTERKNLLIKKNSEASESSSEPSERA